MEELWKLERRQKRGGNHKNIDLFLKGVSVLPLTRQAADKFEQIKTELGKKGDMIGDFDILIAAVTIDYESTLVTNNLNHFRRIEKLNCENWLELVFLPLYGKETGNRISLSMKP